MKRSMLLLVWMLCGASFASGQDNPFPEVDGTLGPAPVGTQQPVQTERPLIAPQATPSLSPLAAPVNGNGNVTGNGNGNVTGNGNVLGMNASPSGEPSPLYTQRYEAPLGLQAASWTYIPPPPTRTLKLHDIVSIRVDELARLQAQGALSSRRNSLYDALLKDWVKMRDGRLEPNIQAAGDPRVQGSINTLYRANSQLESRESLSFNIAASVVDIRPNGTLVLEAHKTIFNNENVWETSLSGICRSQDIGSDNVVLSRDLLDLQIRKNDRGRMRDGYKRGWVTRFVETFAPF